ncbi:hypothetical protein CRI69_20860 [Escherichia sp. E4742]|nr:hypothetical protein FEM44_14045 [Escherichia sp. E4742]TGB55035.1 hypothetical protein CRI69_20860 [Escherichia sp. E4742]TLJ09571.1 hypothetical protein FEK62_14045 [Escherichia sp. E4742]
MSLSQFSSDRTPAKVLVRSWSNALNEVISTSETVCAIDLYKGGHWSMAKSILERYAVDLWVLSAGLGLLHYKDKVAPYNATFATGYEESIPLYSKEYVGKSFHKTWWKELTERSLFKSQHPTSIAELMKNNNQGYFIICGSPDYINAIELDAIHGLEYLREPKKQLLIITSKEISGNLSNYLFKTNKKMAEWLKCNMLMLNISMAKYIIHEFTTKKIDNLNALSQYLSSELQKLPERENKKGIRRNSEEVSHFIVQILQRNPGISATQALRTFRDSGNSFEEKRFRAFFKALSGSKP